MSYIVSKISLENYITKEQFIQHAHTALDFIKSKTSNKIIVAENERQIAIIFKASYEKYLEKHTDKPHLELIPVITTDTILELMIDNNEFDTTKHIKLTEPTLRKQDVDREDLTIILENQNEETITKLTEVLNSEGIFYE